MQPQGRRDTPVSSEKDPARHPLALAHPRMKAKRIPHHGTKSLTDPGARRRLLRTLGIGTSVALAVAVAFLISLRPKKLTDADRTAMRDYEQLRVALAHDDLGAAKNSATAMLRSD